MGQAASALQGIKYIGNLDVSQSTIFPDLAGKTVDNKGKVIQPYVLDLQLQTPLSVKFENEQEAQQYILGQIQQETGANISAKDITFESSGAGVQGGSGATTEPTKQGAGGYNVYVKIAPENAQLLETLYRRADKTGNIWKGRKNLPAPTPIDQQPDAKFPINNRVTPIYQF